MNLMANVVLGLRSLLRNRKIENELDEELRGFVEAAAADNVRGGMSAEEARLAARRQMGSLNSVKHRIRSTGWETKLESFWKDLRYAIRRLGRGPGFTVVAVLSVAVGIGANTAIFSIVEAVLLRPLPFPEAQRLVYLTADMRGTSMPDVGFSLPEMEQIRNQSGVFEDVSPTWPMDGNLTGTDKPSRIEAIAVGNSYFRMLGTKPALGRLFLSEDAIPWMSENTVISYGAWQRLFGSDPRVLGRKIHLDYDPYVVVGVLPRGFRHPGVTLQGEPDFYLTGSFRGGAFPQHPTQTGWRMFPGAICRLRPGISIEQGGLGLTAFSAELRRQFPKEYPAVANWTPRIEFLQQHLAGDSRTVLLVMQGAVGLVLLLCCTTIANLLIARSSLRRKEFALRTALGASRSNIIWQLLVESALISIFGAAAGILLALFLAPLLADSAPFALPHVNRFGINGTALLFTLAASIITAVVCGILPSIHILHSNTMEALKEQGNSIQGQKSGSRLRGLLVSGQFAVSLILLIGAALMCRTLWNVLQVDVGFNPQHVLTGSIWLPPPGDPTARKYAEPEARNIFMKKLQAAMGQIPGVDAAGIGTGDAIPILGWNSSPFAVEGKPDSQGQSLSAQMTSISPDYFHVLGARLLAGRDFSQSDEHGLRVAVINQTMAKTLWRDQNAIGKRTRTGAADSPHWWVIVGVVNDIKADGLDKAAMPHIYFPIYQQSDYALSVFLRTSARPEPYAAALETAVRSVDPDLSVFAIRSMDQVLSRVTGTRRFMLLLLSSFAIAAIGLALMGVTAVTIFAVSQRTQEIGIRMALGADRTNVMRLVLGQGVSLTLWGSGAGLIGALLLTRFLTSFLYGTTPVDPSTFAFATALLMIGSLLACYFPARRAAQMNPVTALRKE